MNGASKPRRLTIERIELDCRGMSAASAEAMARALGPALERALAAVHLRGDPAARIDAGAISHAPTSEALARAIAERIGQRLRGRDD